MFKMNDLKSLISEHVIEQVQKKSRRVCLVRVFQGGRNARQLEPVQQALAEFERKKLIDVEYIDIDKVKTQHLTIQSIVQWLLLSDIHLIITHMHQGIMELHVSCTVSCWIFQVSHNLLHLVLTGNLLPDLLIKLSYLLSST